MLSKKEEWLGNLLDWFNTFGKLKFSPSLLNQLTTVRQVV